MRGTIKIPGGCFQDVKDAGGGGMQIIGAAAEPQILIAVFDRLVTVGHSGYNPDNDFFSVARLKFDFTDKNSPSRRQP
jgi:hypothetical protein